MMKLSYLIAIAVMASFLIYCIVRCGASKKSIAGRVRMLLIAALVPLGANILLVLSQHSLLSNVAYCISYIGTNWVLYLFVWYSMEYCDYPFAGTRLQKLIFAVMLLDSVLLMLNPFTGRAFYMSDTGTGSVQRFVMEPLLWHRVHLIPSYILIVMIFGIFFHKMYHTSKLYYERYMIILLVFVGVSLWESAYIYLNLPADTSMIGYAVCGIMIYYFSLVYQPVILTDRMLAQVVANMNDAVFFFDQGYHCIYMNDSVYRMFRMENRNYAKAEAYLQDYMQKGTMNWDEDFHDFHTLTREDGIHTFMVEYQRLFDDRGIFIGSFISIEDRTQDEENLRRERHIATHDRLTDLYETEHFYNKVEETVRSHPETEYVAVATDIREFKLVNDIFGHDTGDQVLCLMADLIRGYATEHTIYGRLGGDRFGLLIEREEFRDDLLTANVVNRVCIEGRDDFHLVTHVGVYEVKDRELPASGMFDRAYMAITKVKNDVHAGIAWYDRSIRENMLWEQQVTGSVEEAIREGQIVPFLQAQVDASGRLRGAEVLVRWQHPEEGLMAPGRFIGILEQNGMITELDRFIREEACRILRKWKDEGHEELYLSVNVSPKDFYFLDIYETFTELVRKYDLKPNNLRIEITETVMISDIDRKLDIIRRLRRDGFILEMDDFGSGYSSLNLLKDLPIDVLKIDMAFLQKTREPERAQIILKQVINMAKLLLMPVITEGVETQDQVRALSQMGCRMFQGYYFAKPVAVEEFEERYGVGA